MEVTIWRRKVSIIAWNFFKAIASPCIDFLVTERHKQIKKWLRESHPDIKHYFDTWHVAKGVNLPMFQ